VEGRESGQVDLEEFACTIIRSWPNPDFVYAPALAEIFKGNH